ncbi:MAG: Fe-S cluster biogenesis protein NfuA [Planctomycetota bacterium]
MGFISRILGLGGSREEAPAPEGDPVRISEVQTVLAEIAPLLAADGGRARLVSVSEAGAVELALEGACASCALVPLTLKGAIEPKLRAQCPWITEINSVRRP